MRSLDDLKLTPVWVNPGHRVSSARLLLSGHRLRAIAVLEGTKLVGVISAGVARIADPDALVETVMEQPELTLDSALMVPKAAQMFTDADVDFAPVMNDDQFLGMLTAQVLLKELRRSWDPLTNLGWSDRLREWGVEQLKEGKEIALLFIDLDSFGQYNKTYGHIVGDRILRRVASVLRESMDPDKDVLVRFGGDEFAVGTTRGRAAAQELADRLMKRTDELYVDDMQKPVSFTVGISGGRRTKERENVHYGATFDELLNAASRDCMKNKPESTFYQGRDDEGDGGRAHMPGANGAEDAASDAEKPFSF